MTSTSPDDKISATNVDNTLTLTPNTSQTPSAMASISATASASSTPSISSPGISSTPSTSTPSTSSASGSTVTGRYRKYLVEPKDSAHGEYVYHLRVQYTLDLAKPKKSHKPNTSQLHLYNTQCRQYEQYLQDMDELDVLTTALICTSGGLVKVDSVMQITDLVFDNWCLNYKGRLCRFISKHVYQQCIDIRFDSGSIFLLVTKTPEFITTNTHMQTRADGCNLPINYYQDVVALLSQPITPPVQISLQPSYNYGDVFTYSETKNIEFKCFTTTSVNGLMDDLTRGRNHGLFFGFGNTRGGGYAMIGIHEDTNYRGNIGTWTALAET